MCWGQREQPSSRRCWHGLPAEDEVLGQAVVVQGEPHQLRSGGQAELGEHFVSGGSPRCGG